MRKGEKWVALMSQTKGNDIILVVNKNPYGNDLFQHILFLLDSAEHLGPFLYPAVLELLTRNQISC